MTKSHKTRKTKSRRVFDVMRPGKATPSATSRPVIVSHQPMVQDATLTNKPGLLKPVTHAHALMDSSDKVSIQPPAETETRPAATSAYPTHMPPELDSTPASIEPKVAPMAVEAPVVPETESVSQSPAQPALAARPIESPASPVSRALGSVDQLPPHDHSPILAADGAARANNFSTVSEQQPSVVELTPASTHTAYLDHLTTEPYPPEDMPVEGQIIVSEHRPNAVPKKWLLPAMIAAGVVVLVVVVSLFVVMHA